MLIIASVSVDVIVWKVVITVNFLDSGDCNVKVRLRIIQLTEMKRTDKLH